MDFAILGPLEIRRNGRTVPCKGAKQRLLLATLLLHVNEVVSSDRLIDALWVDDPPPTAHKALQVHISQLRRLLEPGLVITRPPGYELRLAPGHLDLTIFASQVAEARAARSIERASALLTEALALWRGPPLADLTFEEFLQPEIARLEELRVTALEDRVDADLQLGRHGELVGELEALAAAQPLRERIHGQLMLALYRSGRQAEALDVYAVTRARLVGELGLEPGRELQALQRQILAHDPALDQGPERQAEGLLGREHELAELARRLDGAIAGRGAVVLIGGEPGIGKSRLAETLARHADAAGADVAVGRCWEAGGAPAFWPWVQALRALLPARDVSALTDLVGAQSGGREYHQGRFLMFDGIAGLLRTAAAERPVALFLDDIHAADTPSLLLLRFVAAELSNTPVAVVGCYRDSEVGPDLAEALAELSREPIVTRVNLHGLDPAATARLLAATMGHPPSAELAQRVHAETGGNPLFAGELGRLFATEGIPADAGARLPIPEGAREAIRRRLQRQSQRCRDVLTMASVLGREFELPALAEVADVSADDLAGAIDEATSAHLVGPVPGTNDRVRFAHILVRDALYEDLPAVKRQALHRRMGESLEALYEANPAPHLAEIAHHYVHGGTGAAPKAIRYAIAAGDHAASQYGYEDAARHYEHALALLEDHGDTATTCDVLLSLGASLSRAGSSAKAKESLRRAATIAEAQGWPDRLALAALTYGGRFAWARGSTDPALVPLLERALAAVGDGDELTRARLLARLAAAVRDTPRPEPRIALAEEAVAIARRHDDLVTRAYAVEGYWIAIEGPDDLEKGIEVGDELIALGRRIGDPEHEFTGRDFRLNAFWKLANRAGVDVELDVLTDLAEQLRQPAWRWWVSTTSTMRTLMEGRFDAAEQLIQDARTVGEQAERWNAHLSERLQMFVLRRAQGRLAELEELFARSIHEYPTLIRFRCALAHLYSELGDTRGTRLVMDELLSRDLAHEHRDAEWLFSIALLADPCRYLGDKDAAAYLYELLLPYAGAYAQAPVEVSFGSAARTLGVLTIVLERFDDAVRHLDAAVETERRMRARPWAAHAQHDLAAALLARGAPGDSERARQLIGEVTDAYRQLGMESWAERAHGLAARGPR